MVEKWLEVSLVVDGELAEAVAEVLARYIPDGIVIEATAIESSAEHVEGRPAGPLRVCGYLPVNERLEETRQRIEEALWYLGRIRPLPAAQYRPVEEQNWAETWKRHYRPVPIGNTLVIVPAWLESPEPQRLPIRIDPGMAFGTGTHPTTRLCLSLLEERVAALRARPDWPEGLRVIDVGCGSGILSIAALKMGIPSALGVDLDPDAIAVARKNARLNGVESRLELGRGSVGEIRRGEFSIQQAELVFANILAPVIIRLLGENLSNLVAPRGVLLLSGILEEQAAEVERALERHEMVVFDRRQIDDWVALVTGVR